MADNLSPAHSADASAPVPGISDMTTKQLNDLIPLYRGFDDNISSETWTNMVRSVLGDKCAHVSPLQQISFICNRLPARLAKRVKEEGLKTVDSLLQEVENKFPVHIFREMLVMKLRDGLAFVQSGRKTLVKTARRIFESVSDMPEGPKIVAEALERVSPEAWACTGADAANVTRQQFEDALNIFELAIRKKPVVLNLTPSKPSLGKLPAASPKNLAENTAQTSVPDPVDKSKKPVALPRHQCCQELYKVRAELAEYKLREIEAAADLARAQSEPTPPACQKPQKSSHRTYPRFAGWQSWTRSARVNDGRCVSPRAWLEGLQIGETIIRAAADSGPKTVSAITLDAANRLGLAVDTNWRPRLIPAWTRVPHLAAGYAEVTVNFADGPRRRTRVAVIDQQQPWDLLVGSKLLDALDVELVTLTKRRCWPISVKNPGACGEAQPLEVKKEVCTDEEYGAGTGDAKAATEETAACSGHTDDAKGGTEKHSSYAKDMRAGNLVFDQLNALLRSLSPPVGTKHVSSSPPAAESRAVLPAIDDSGLAYCAEQDPASTALHGYHKRHTIAEEPNDSEGTLIAGVSSSPSLKGGLALQSRPVKRSRLESTSASLGERPASIEGSSLYHYI
ncbi:hypothetical protein GGF42_007330 [Coemansia sp. RSA 2424]|nr:hypothetical protein GGF42_007330 [Coemansia sp. RSA 2424]